MPFRTLDPELTDQLATNQARRAASLERAHAGRQVRFETSQARHEAAIDRPLAWEELSEKRCMRRLDDTADGSGLWALAFLLGLATGPLVAIVAFVVAMSFGPSWIHLAVAVCALGATVAMIESSIRRSRRRFEAFRAELRALPFTIDGAEQALGFNGTLARITLTITPVGEIPIDTLADLVALVSPDVRVAIGEGGTTVFQGMDGEVSIARTFKVFTSSQDGSVCEEDGSERARWLQAVIRTTLVPLHELHAIATVDVEPTGG